MFDGQFFKNALRDKKLSIRGAASLLGMKHHSQLSLMLSGKRRMQLDEAIALSKLLTIPLNSVIAHGGYPEIMREGRRVSIAGVLREGGVIEDVPTDAERVVSPGGVDHVVSAVQARTTDTSLMWMDRFVFFCGERIKPDDSIEGRFCHVGLKSGTQVMATVRRGYNVGSFNLIGPYTAEDAVIDWVAPVVVTRN